MEPEDVDFPADVTTTGRIDVGSWVTGTIERSWDEDWFAVDLVEGIGYVIWQDAYPDGPGRLIDPYIFGVYSDTGSFIANSEDDDSGEGRNAMAIVVAPETGRHFVAAGAWNNLFGTYSVGVREFENTGTAGNDWVTAQVGETEYDGRAGTDMLSLGAFGQGVSVYRSGGAVEIYAGWDARAVAVGFEGFTGTGNADHFESVGATLYRGLGGADRFSGGAATETFDGGAGHDTVSYGSSATGVSASLLRERGWTGHAAGDRFLNVEALAGSQGADALTGDHGANRLAGEGGDDTLIGNGGDDSLFGGAGSDVAIFSFAQSEYTVRTEGRTVIVAHVGGTGADGTDRVLDVETLRFADGERDLTHPFGPDLAADGTTTGAVAVGGQIENAIEQRGDVDWIAVDLVGGTRYGIWLAPSQSPIGPLYYPLIRGVFDASGVIVPGTVSGGGTWPGVELDFVPAVSGRYFVAASSAYNSYTGTYVLAVAEADLVGTAGDDWLVWKPGILDVEGGGGIDMLSFLTATSGLYVVMESGTTNVWGTAFSLEAKGIEGITGTASEDWFQSDQGGTFRGLGGADRFVAGAGIDVLDGGAGLDTVSYQAASGGVSVSLLRGRGWVGDAAGDRLVSIETLIGSRWADDLTGDSRGNRLEGGAGDDTLTGNGGDDSIFGGVGTDTVVFNHARAEYEVTTEGTRVTVDHVGGDLGDRTDVLTGVEILQFADGVLLV